MKIAEIAMTTLLLSILQVFFLMVVGGIILKQDYGTAGMAIAFYSLLIAWVIFSEKE